MGNSGTGTFNQSGGTNGLAGAGLYLGYNSGATGTYNLSASGTLTCSDVLFYYGFLNLDYDITYGDEIVGDNGAGTFNQTGGTNTLTNTDGLNIAYANGSTGTYNLSGTGTLTCNNNEYIGLGGAGTFNQTGGTNTAATIYIAANSGSSGTYTLSGGKATAEAVLVGSGGTGILNVSGSGTLNVTSVLAVNDTIGCSINFSGGTINAAALDFNGDSSLFNWTGGNLDLTTSITWDSGAASSSTSDAFWRRWRWEIIRPSVSLEPKLWAERELSASPSTAGAPMPSLAALPSIPLACLPRTQAAHSPAPPSLKPAALWTARSSTHRPSFTRAAHSTGDAKRRHAQFQSNFLPRKRP